MLGRAHEGIFAFRHDEILRSVNFCGVLERGGKDMENYDVMFFVFVDKNNVSVTFRCLNCSCLLENFGNCGVTCKKLGLTKD